MKPFFLPSLLALSLSLNLVACQTSTPSQTGHVEANTPPFDPPTRSYPALSKASASGSLRLDNNTLILTLNLPELPEPLDAQAFATQKLDLSTTTKLFAQVSDSHGKTYAPNGADGDGAVNYTGGTITLTFNNLTPDELLFVDVQAKNGTTPIPQAELATVIKHTTDPSPVSATLNFQTAVAAKALKAMLPTHATQARSIDLTTLNTLTASITGVTGTAPNLTYSQNHPSLVNTALLATHLQSQAPNTLTASNYRQSGATVNLTISGLAGSDKVQVQVTDAASAVRTNLGNGSTNITGLTPGSGLTAIVTPFGSPVQTYSYNTTPTSLTFVEGEAINLTVTATPDVSISSFSPVSGEPGTTVTLNGTGFIGTTAVNINGVNANFTVNSDTLITLTVPSTATDGLIRVIKGGTFSSTNSFDVQNTWFVNHNANGSNNGTTWPNAFTNLTAALNVAQAGDQVWIATGSYKPGVNTTDSFVIPASNIKIYGGFSGNETSLNQRNPINNPTILSADLNGDDDYSGSLPTNVSDNSKTVIRVSFKNNIVLEDLIVQGGYDPGESQGGGIYSDRSSITGQRLSFLYNQAREGGAIAIRGGSFSLENGLFYKNHAINAGGYGGGAIYTASNVTDPQVNLKNVVIANNTAQTGWGGGIAIRDSSATILFHNVTFSQNNANQGGGGIANFGSVITSYNTLFYASDILNFTAPQYVPSNTNGDYIANTDPFVGVLDVLGSDGSIGTSDDGLQLSSGAAAIDQGINVADTPTHDIINLPRNGNPEPGAYEYTAPPPPPVSNFTITGTTANDKVGHSVSGAGDLNNDGFDDFIVGAHGTNSSTGKTYVVFGNASLGSGGGIALASLDGSNGFALNGEANNDQSGYNVSGAGDVNNDGFADLIIGASGANSGTGKSYVIFGGANAGSSGSINLSALNGTNGFVLNGEATGDQSGVNVSAAGDVNNDGIDDLMIGAFNANGFAGKTYVVFGGTNLGSSGSLNLSTLNGTNGFDINGANASDASGSNVSAAGDVNNDGVDDLIVGAYGPNSYAGKSYVIFGGTNIGSSGSLALSSLNGTNGFSLNGENASDFSGISVSGAGDVNNDGFDDLMVGAYGFNSTTGKAYVVFGGTNIGSSGSIALSSLNGSNGFSLTGENTSDYLGISVSSAGDLNNDGFDDLIAGASNFNSSTGKSYVIFGGANVGSSGSINLSSLNGTNGFALNGEATGDQSGLSVSNAGDLNNDGFADLLIGAYGKNSFAGKAYVVFGSLNLGSTGSLNLSDVGN